MPGETGEGGMKGEAQRAFKAVRRLSVITVTVDTCRDTLSNPQKAEHQHGALLQTAASGECDVPV